MNPEEIYLQTKEAIEELLVDQRPGLNPVRLMVMGGSSSEVAGGVLGHNSSYELGEAMAKGALEVAHARGFDIAFQCCEHLNRCLVMERAAAERRDYEIVTVVPQPKAGGSLATAAWRAMEDPVAVLRIEADAGLDVGLTLVGMHLRRVAIPIRLTHNRVGRAPVAAARTRPMLIGGERAKYE